MQSAFSYAEGMSMTDAAWLFIQAEEELYAAENTYEIRQRMFDRGFIPWVGIEDANKTQGLKILNSEGFAQGKEHLVIEFAKKTDARIFVFDALGRTVLMEDVTGKIKWTLSPNYIQVPGFYAISIIQNGKNHEVKILRFK
jgi:hypothetical protein